MATDEDVLELAAIVTRLSRERHCRRCGFHFTEMQNMGTLKCSFHPMLPGPSGKYKCCGKDIRDGRLPYGCVRADHTTVVGHERPYRLSSQLAAGLQIGEDTEARSRDYQTGDVLIVRFDKRRAEYTRAIR